MALLTWRKEYELGLADVDHEHRELIDLINQIHQQLDAGARGDAALDLLGELYAQIASHFALEEQHMRTIDYKELDDHKADHERLLDRIRDLMDEYEDNATLDLHAFGVDLDAWFLVHFSTRDARFHRALH
ncbi:MAG: hemerythrin family protein [Gammaproteobacteria bacterium]|nr:hemerythrin family protein [Gammaproteobacteria bacterium]